MRIKQSSVPGMRFHGRFVESGTAKSERRPAVFRAIRLDLNERLGSEKKEQSDCVKKKKRNVRPTTRTQRRKKPGEGEERGRENT